MAGHNRPRRLGGARLQNVTSRPIYFRSAAGPIYRLSSMAEPGVRHGKQDRLNFSSEAGLASAHRNKSSIQVGETKTYPMNLPHPTPASDIFIHVLAKPTTERKYAGG